jgi:predicted HTH domain antitoxin
VNFMTNRPYPLRIPEGLLQLAELRSQEERTDKTTALQQWLYASAEEYALQRLSEGRLTVSRAAELLDLSVYDVQRKAQERGIAIGATAEQYQHALKTARQLHLIRKE